MWGKIRSSRKFWAAIGSALVVVMTATGLVDESTATTLVHIGMAYIVGQGIADAGAGGSQP